MEGYSYTTIAVHPGQAPRILVTLRLDESVRVGVPRGYDGAQITIEHADAHVTITPAGTGAPSAEEVRLARELADHFAAYAGEVERLHNESAASGESGGSGSSGRTAA